MRHLLYFLKSLCLLSCLVASSSATSSSASITPDEWMDWAEANVPEALPGSPPTLGLCAEGFTYAPASGLCHHPSLGTSTSPTWRYRVYVATRNHLGVDAGGAVYALGPVTGDALLRLGVLGDFVCRVKPGLCPSPPPQGTRVFTFRLHGTPASEAFRVASASPTFIAQARAQLALPESQRRVFVAGSLQAGPGGHNSPWSWHLGDASLVEATVELCDGRPSMVEGNLGYWLGTVRNFCPWASYVYSEDD